MNRTTYIIWMLVLSILLVLTIPYLWYILKVIITPDCGFFWGREKTYTWTFFGILICVFLRLVIRSKSRIVETLSHELTHAFVAFFCGRKVHSIHIEDSGSGMVFTSGFNNHTIVPVALAPYCFPLFTYILLIVRSMIDSDSLWIYDIFVGITICFHFICFKKQIGNYQTDINQYPLSFSYYYIVVAWLINICIILVSFNPEMFESGGIWGEGIFSSIFLLFMKWWENLLTFIHWLL